MFGAYATVKWATFDFLGSGVLYAVAVVAELLCPHVLLVVRPVKFLERAVLGAFFLDEDFAAVLVDFSVQRLEAFGADALCVFDVIHVYHLVSIVNDAVLKRGDVIDNKVSKRLLR